MIFARRIAPPAWFLAVVSLVPAFMLSVSAQSVPELPPDKYAWLEDIHGDKPLSWVKEHDQRTAAVLEKDPRFGQLQAEALKVLDSPDRLAWPDFHGGSVYNFWQDAQHVRGILRRTTLKDYLSSAPKWDSVLDYDELAKKDNQSWVAKDIHCLHPVNELCMVEFSAGGEDAVTVRETDLKTGKFIEGGFVLPRGKQNYDWVDKDTLLVSREWGPGTMTESGYPFIVRVWKRRQPVESAAELFRGTAKDVGVVRLAMKTAKGIARSSLKGT